MNPLGANATIQRSSMCCSDMQAHLGYERHFWEILLIDKVLALNNEYDFWQPLRHAGPPGSCAFGFCCICGFLLNSERGMQVAVAGKAIPAIQQRAPSPPPLRPLPMNAPAVAPPAASAAAAKSPAQPRRSRRGTASGAPGDPDKPPGAGRRRTRTASDEGEGLVLGKPSEGNGVGPGRGCPVWVVHNELFLDLGWLQAQYHFRLRFEPAFAPTMLCSTHTKRMLYSV